MTTNRSLLFCLTFTHFCHRKQIILHWLHLSIFLISYATTRRFFSYNFLQTFLQNFRSSFTTNLSETTFIFIRLKLRWRFWIALNLLVYLTVITKQLLNRFYRLRSPFFPQTSSFQNLFNLVFELGKILITPFLSSSLHLLQLLPKSKIIFPILKHCLYKFTNCSLQEVHLALNLRRWLWKGSNFFLKCSFSFLRAAIRIAFCINWRHWCLIIFLFWRNTHRPWLWHSPFTFRTFRRLHFGFALEWL